METSSQIEGFEHLDETTDICAEYLRLKIRSLMIMRILWKFPSVDMIVASRVPNLIKLEETTISADQDHNYLMEDEWKENIDEELSLAIKQHFRQICDISLVSK